ncbi:malonyl-CoA decarboxylase [Aliamphritea hakodatensis]|uniref:malonyl-CoA decarboxylase n=1 Tax=Aliamphritea hakodatensis TaxID=2895352 RepID=UPI0022FD9B0C|nr:malonyl-CoA decarboxylase [Aliamphritea hakodatensis]
MRLNRLLSSVADAGRELLSRKNTVSPQKDLEDYCAELLTSKGEALGTAIAVEVVNAYRKTDSEAKLSFFQHLIAQYSPSADEVIALAEAYKLDPSFGNFAALNDAVESPRQMLFRRINMAPQGTETIVSLRHDLLSMLKQYPELKPIDYDLQHLLKSWFNRGFLSLEEVSWQTPARILEKLMRYEAVHSMSGWDDLKKRLSHNRRCFAFFHPSLPEEPLIFVEVALVNGLADSVVPLINPQETTEEIPADTAIFYSISNCQTGLAGISFGNFLIKQVVLELQRELPELKQFATLSPIPGFMRWLDTEVNSGESAAVSEEEQNLLELLNLPDWQKNTTHCEKLEPLLTRLCTYYLTTAKKGRNPYDPVARFHLGNGARIERLNWMGDPSEKGLKQSAGLLVNYFYDISQVEANHESFINDGQVITAKSFAKAY